LKGRMIFVREDRETSSGGGGGGAGQQSGFRGTGTSVYVGNLDYDISWQDLKDHMRGAGNVDQVRMRCTQYFILMVLLLFIPSATNSHETIVSPSL
jgi:RNA recognition motif-containing protein